MKNEKNTASKYNSRHDQNSAKMANPQTARNSNKSARIWPEGKSSGIDRKRLWRRDLKSGNWNSWPGRVRRPEISSFLEENGLGPALDLGIGLAGHASEINCMLASEPMKKTVGTAKP
jgi:hypothetical protein